MFPKQEKIIPTLGNKKNSLDSNATEAVIIFGF